MPRTIFLDVDGVLADCVTPLYEVFGSPITYKTLKTYDISDTLCLSYEEVWGHPAISSMEFWANLPILPWAKVVFNYCKSLGDVAFLTQTIRSPQCLAGKKAWLDKYFHNVPFFICNKKVVLSKPGLILVDDYQKNINEWNHRGGTGILFPASWNKLGHQDDPMPYLTETLK